jgi:hypothetical protein
VRFARRPLVCAIGIQLVCLILSWSANKVVQLFTLPFLQVITGSVDVKRQRVYTSDPCGFDGLGSLDGTIFGNAVAGLIYQNLLLLALIAQFISQELLQVFEPSFLGR